jgi:hypothetical protein
MRTLLILSVCTAAIAAGPVAARADGAVARVGIVVNVTVNVDAATAESLGGQLASALVKKLKVDAIGGGEVSRRMPPTGLPDECVSTPACIADLGQRLGADQLIFLGVVRVGTDYQVDATWVDVASGKQEARPRVALTDPHKAADKFAAEAERYLPDAEVRGGNTQTVVVRTDGERHRPIKPLVWVAAGVGVAALATGVVLGLQAKSKYDNCNNPMGPYCDDDQRDAIDRRALFSDISLGVGLAAAAGAVVLYFTTPVEVLPVTPSVEAVPGGAVLSFDGQF